MSSAVTDGAWCEVLAQRLCVAAGARGAGTDGSLAVRWSVAPGHVEPPSSSAQLGELVAPDDSEAVVQLGVRAAHDGAASAEGPSGTRYDVVALPASATVLCWIWRPAAACRSEEVRRSFERRLLRFVVDLGVMIGTSPHVDALPGVDMLSARERATVVALLAGQRTATISRDLGVSDSTVRSHLSAAYEKLGVTSQAELIERFRTR